MAEKGGKGFSNGKSALKSSGNENGSPKSKKGKKVQFDSEGSLEGNTLNSNGREDTPAAKGGWGKGGKGDKVANGGKKPTAKATPPVERRLEQEIPPNSTCLMDCEAAEILQGIQDQMVLLSEDPEIKIPVSFDSGLMYASRVGNYTRPQTVKKIFEPLKKHGVSDCEICLISNLHPEAVDEVFALIPSLKPKMSKVIDPLRIALGELAKLKEALEELANIRTSI